MNQRFSPKKQIGSFLLQTLEPKRFLPGLIAGLVNGVLTVIVQISFAVMIFAHHFPDYLATGIGLALFGGLTLGLITALTSSFQGSVSEPQDGPTAILAVVATAIVADMPASTPSEAAFLTLVATIIVTTFLTGTFFFLLGRFKLGFLVRFLPYPVMGGFLAGTGWLLFLGGIGIATNVTPSLAQFPQFFQMDLLVKWLPSLIFAVLLLIILRRSSHFLMMPALLLGAVGLFYLILFLTGTSHAEAIGQGWLMEPFAAGALWQPLIFRAFGQADWLVVLGQIGSVGSILLISVISLLLNVSGLELTVQRDIDLNHELQALGVANIVAGLGGSPPGYPALGFSALGYRIAGNTRLVGLVLAGVCGAALVFGASLLSFFPKPVIGGLILFLGLDFLTTWVYDTWFRLPKLDYALIVAIVAVTGMFGFLAGVTFGLLAAIILFVITYSRVNVVKLAMSGNRYQSTVVRPRLYEKLLHQKGDWLYILKLHGFIFFGTAHQLLTHLKQRLSDPRQLDLRYVVFDFQQVTGLDSSAVLSFIKIKQLAQQQNIILVFTHLSSEIEQQLKKEILDHNRCRLFDDLDHGLEWCENQMIAAFESVGLAARPKTLKQYLEALLPGTAKGLFDGFDQVEPSLTEMRPGSKRVTDLLESFKFEGKEQADPTPLQSKPTSLMNYLEYETIEAGHYLIRQGDVPQGLYFIEKGQVTIQLKNDDGSIRRLQTLQAGTVVGEVGLYSGWLAPASVVADEPSTVYRLSLTNLSRLEQEDPEVVIVLHKFMARLLSEQVATLYTTVQTLQSLGMSLD
jgi:SulP family sulfate permease